MAKVNTSQATLDKIVSEAGLTMKKIGKSHYELSCPVSGVIGIGNGRNKAYKIAWQYKKNKADKVLVGDV